MEKHNVNNVNEAYGKIIAALRSVRRTWRWLAFSEGVLMCIGILAFAMTGALVCFQLPSPRWMRIAIILIGIGIGIWMLIRYLILPLCRKLTDATVAARLEKTAPASAPASEVARLQSAPTPTKTVGSENRILSAVQLKSALADNRFGYAPEFVEQLIFESAREVERIQPKQVFAHEYRHIKRNAGIAGLAVGLLLITHFLWLPTAFKGFAQTFRAIPKTPQEVLNVQISDVHPGNVHIERGTTVTITANVSGHLGAPVSLSYRIGEADAPTEWHSLAMHRSPTEILYSATIENVNRSLQYYITTKEVASEKYQITVSREPVVKQFQIRLNYPAYTQLPPQTLEANIGDIHALFGTEIGFTGESNKPLASAHLEFEESGDVSLEIIDAPAFAESGEIGAQRETNGTGSAVENRAYRGEIGAQRETNPRAATRIRGTFIAQKSENYRIRLTDVEDNLTNRAPIRWTLNVVKDAVPAVDIIEPARDSVLDDAMFVELKIEATDDYGVQALQLVYWIEREGAAEVNVPLKLWNPVTAQQSVFLTYTWDVDAVDMFPGETLAYYVQALDTDNVSGPNVGKSLTYTLRFPSLSEMYDAISDEQQTEQQGIEELFDEQAEAAGLVDTLLDKIRKSQQLTLKDENLMQQVLETQKQIEESATSLIEDMKKTAAEMDKNQLFDRETLQKYQELQELMEEALSDEHKELLQKLSEALAEQELSEQEKALMEANLNQEQFLQQIERAKSLYEQLLLQQELEAAVKQAEALAEQQKELMDTLDAIEEGSRFSQEGAQEGQSTDTRPADTPQTLAQKEERVGSEVAQLQEKLDTLGSKMGELAEKQGSETLGGPPQIERLAEEIKRLNQFAQEQKLAETLQETSANLRSEQNQQALQSGREAQQTMTELAQGLDNALEFMEGANANETQAAMQQAVSSALHLSHLHEEVLEQTEALSASAAAERPVDGEIKRMQQLAAEELSAAEGLERLATQLWELGTRQMEVEPEIVWALNASNDAMSRAARALEDRQPGLAVPIQRAALAELNAAIFQLLNAMAQMNQQMGASGLENMMQQLQQLAQSQEQLNQMAQNLSQQMRQQGQTPGLQQLLRQLAGQQQLIREATERLAEMAEQMAEMLGSLEDVAEEMAEVEKSLKQGELNRQVLDRQEQILTRMLDSLKSLQKRDVGKQRKAQVAKNPTAPAQEVPPLHPELLEIVRKLETAPNATEVENIPFQYREQLRQYFKALSQRTEQRKRD